MYILYSSPITIINKKEIIMLKMININGLIVEIERKKIKNMYLRILPPDGRVRISAPNRMSEETIRSFVISKYDWINSNSNKIKARSVKQEENEDIDIVPGSFVCLWGKKYEIKLEYSSGYNIVIQDGAYIIIRLKKSQDKCENGYPAKLLKEFYKASMIKEIPALAARWEDSIGVRASEWRVKEMKTRWGSCNTRDKRIWLNLKLAKKSPECLEYVIVHELVHLLEQSHNYIFKAYMDKFLPDWRDIKARLNGK